jgi:hypothetical protein
MLQQIGYALASLGLGLIGGAVVLRLTWARRVRAEADSWNTTVAMHLSNDPPSDRGPSLTGAFDSLSGPEKRRFILQ